jgi:hypothetical protein
VLARDAEPDHGAVARFISSQALAVKDLFARAPLKCYALGLTGGELFAIDGRELPSNAAKERPGDLYQSILVQGPGVHDLFVHIWRCRAGSAGACCG